MSIEYQPVNYDTGRSLAGGMDALGDAIKAHTDNLKKLKGAKLLAEGYGLDTSQLGSVEEVQGALGAEIARQQRAGMQREREATAAIPGFFNEWSRAQQPQPGAPNVQPPGQLWSSVAMGEMPPMASGVQMKPGLDRYAALGQALQKFAPVLNDPEVRKSVLGAAIKQGLLAPKTPQFTTDPQGNPIAIDPTGRVQWGPKGGSGAKAAPKTVLLEDPATGRKFGASWSEASGKYELFPQEKTAPAARQPAGAGPIMSKDGRFYWDEENGRWLEARGKENVFGGGGTTPEAAAAPANAKDPLGLGL